MVGPELFQFEIADHLFPPWGHPGVHHEVPDTGGGEGFQCVLKSYGNGGGPHLELL